MHASPAFGTKLPSNATSLLETRTLSAQQATSRSVTAPARQTLDYPGVFAGLRSTPVRQASRPQLATRACATPSPANLAKSIDPTRVDLAEAIAQVDMRSDPSQTCQDHSRLDMQRRVVLECMRTCAGEAYTADLANVPDIGKLQFETPMSSPRLKLWHGTSGDVLTIVLGFSGTRMEEMDDLLCDVKSQIARPHSNSFDQHLPALGEVGSGWQEWWRSEALLPRGAGVCMKDVLVRYAEMAKESGKALSVSLAGHSLGAAVATLAGFDIAHFLRMGGTVGKVSIYAFNPPRLGSKGIETQYMGTLASRPVSEGSALCFSLRQFTRDLDPVQSAPLFMHHPHWSSDGDRDANCNNKVSGDRLANFITCTDRAASSVNLSLNHELSLWREYFTSKIRGAELKSIFEAHKEHSIVSDAPILSRRQLLTSMFMSREYQNV